MWQATMEMIPAAPSARTSAAAEQERLNRLRRQVDERWRALALAQEPARPVSTAMLERLYDAYMRAVDAYVTRLRALTRPCGEQRRAS